MKFCKHLGTAAEASAAVVGIDDWMDYKSLKKMLKDMHPLPKEEPAATSGEADAGGSAGDAPSAAATRQTEPADVAPQPASSSLSGASAAVQGKMGPPPSVVVVVAPSSSSQPQATTTTAATTTATTTATATDLARTAQRLGASEEERQFFRALLQELDKVSRKYAELQRDALSRAERSLTTDASNPDLAAGIRALTDTHLFLLLVENFAVLNYCGFRKILKKHDKLRVTTTKDIYMARMVNAKPIAQLEPLRNALERVERAFEKLTRELDAQVAAAGGSRSERPRRRRHVPCGAMTAAQEVGRRGGREVATGRRPLGQIAREVVRRGEGHDDGPDHRSRMVQ